MKQFTNLSQFKNLLAVGVQLHTVWHTAANGRDEKGKLQFKDEDRGVREVSIKQTNSFALKTPEKKDGQPTGKMVDSWCQYPKATEVVIKENVLEIWEEDFRLPTDQRKKAPKIKMLTYKFVD